MENEEETEERISDEITLMLKHQTDYKLFDTIISFLYGKNSPFDEIVKDMRK